MKKYSILRRDKKKLLKICLQIKLRDKENIAFGDARKISNTHLKRSQNTNAKPDRDAA